MKAVFSIKRSKLNYSQVKKYASTAGNSCSSVRNQHAVFYLRSFWPWLENCTLLISKYYSFSILKFSKDPFFSCAHCFARVVVWCPICLIGQTPRINTFHANFPLSYNTWVACIRLQHGTQCSQGAWPAKGNEEKFQVLLFSGILVLLIHYERSMNKTINRGLI